VGSDNKTSRKKNIRYTVQMLTQVKYRVRPHGMVHAYMVANAWLEREKQMDLTTGIGVKIDTGGQLTLYRQI